MALKKTEFFKIACCLDYQMTNQLMLTVIHSKHNSDYCYRLTLYRVAHWCCFQVIF